MPNPSTPAVSSNGQEEAKPVPLPAPATPSETPPPESSPQSLPPSTPASPLESPPGFTIHPATEWPGDFPDTDPSVTVLRAELNLGSKAKGMKDPAVVHYRIPLKADKRPGKNAHTVVFYCPFLNDTNTVDAREQLALCDLLGFTVISFRIKTDINSINNPENVYWMPESGWDDLVWEAVEKVREKHQLNPGKIFLWGNSAGGAWAQRLALRNPDRVQAVAMIGGSGFDKVTGKTEIAWLLMNTAGASEAGDNLALAENLRTLGDPVIHVQPPPDRRYRGRGDFLHAPGPLALSLMQSFFWAMAPQRRPEKEPVRDGHWSFAGGEQPPYTVFKREDFEASAPPGHTLLPSESMAYFWTRLPNPVQPITVTVENRPFRLYQALPKFQTVQGLVVTSIPYSVLNYPTIVNDLSHWSELGFAALALRQVVRPAGAEAGRPTGPEVPDFLTAWLKQNPEHAQLPIYLSCRLNDPIPPALVVPPALRARLRGMVVSGFDADMKESDARKAAGDLALSPPTLVMIRTHHHPKSENAEKINQKIERDFRKLGPHFQPFLLPPAREVNEEKERYLVISQAETFFSKAAQP